MFVLGKFLVENIKVFFCVTYRIYFEYIEFDIGRYGFNCVVSNDIFF